MYRVGEALQREMIRRMRDVGCRGEKKWEGKGDASMGRKIGCMGSMRN
jgi:hypothetical protein